MNRTSIRKRKNLRYDSTGANRQPNQASTPTIAQEENVLAQAGIVTNMAVYRIIIFSLMVYEWCSHMPNYPFRGDVQDSWMTYDQFEFFFTIAPKTGEPYAVYYCTVVLYFGIACGVLAALGGIRIGSHTIISFEVSATLFIVCYAVRFLTLVTRFTNHNYLFLLLMVLVTLSGGGSLSRCNVDTNIIRRCQWAALTIRFQYAIIYLFASMWKMHWDWLDGTIVRNIMLTFEAANVSRGLRWTEIEKAFPAVFFFVAFGGIILDSGMCLSLTLYQPGSQSRYRFILLSVIFHGFVCYSMSQRIGYTFPATCLAGSLLYAPFGKKRTKNIMLMRNSKVKGQKLATSMKTTTDDCNLIDWMYRYVRGVSGSSTTATPWQRLFTIVWVFWQLAFPLRMVFISSGNFPFTGQGYRFSWTMMLHSRAHYILHTTSTSPPQKLPIQLFYIEPKCNGRDHIYRTNYMPGTENGFEDPRTLPLFTHLIRDARSVQTMNVYPRHIARVGGGMHGVFNAFPNICSLNGGNITIHATHYAQLNTKGPFSRLIDPTVDLGASERARKERTFLQTWYDVTLDIAPKGHEYLLKGVGSLRQKVIDVYLPRLKKLVSADEFETEKDVHIEFFADRAACLMHSPLKISLQNFPAMVFLVESPCDATLLNYRGNESQTLALPIGGTPVLHVDSVEIGLAKNSTHVRGACAETEEEDVLFALVFMI